MLVSLSKYLGQHLLASPLCIWGKLPQHGDFLKHRCNAAQAHDWQDWAARTWSLRPTVAPERRFQSQRTGQPTWVKLEPRQALADLIGVPVAFVMQPGAMPFAAKRYVQGVILDSQDQQGRACPLIIYQQVSPTWMRRSWCLDRVSQASAHVSLMQQRTTQNHHLLYWLARLAARIHGADRQWAEVTQLVDAIWDLHRPTWRHLRGAVVNKVDQTQLDALLHRHCFYDGLDVAKGLRGVQHLPWANWPDRLFDAGPVSQAFWQQDVHGGYVNAGESLPALWGASA